MMRVSVFGLGYVGCVSAARLAEAGHEVIGIDINEEKVRMINGQASPIIEPGLEKAIAKVVKTGRLRATSCSQDAVDHSDLALICVGTPGFANGQLNVDALTRVSGDIGQALKRHGGRYTVVIRSTVLPGTTHGVVIPAIRAGMGGRYRSQLRVAVNPEFMREGTALWDFVQPPLTLVGCEETETASLLRSLYNCVDAPFVHTRVQTAEMVKYVSNAFHALKVCFANEIGDACKALGTDSQEVMRIFQMDRKLNLSAAYLRPGFAFGGSCLPKDLRALLYAVHRADLSLPLLGTILPSNEAQVRQAVEAVLSTRKRRVGVVGLSFKPGTDDLRESPMVSLVEALIGKGCDVRILDQNVSVARLVGANRRYIEEEIPHIASLMCGTAETLIAHADVLVIGCSGDEASEILPYITPAQTVVDLTRGAARLQWRARTELASACM